VVLSWRCYRGTRLSEIIEETQRRRSCRCWGPPDSDTTVVPCGRSTWAEDVASRRTSRLYVRVHCRVYPYVHSNHSCRHAAHLRTPVMQRDAGQIWCEQKKQEQRPLATHVVLEWRLERCSSTTIMWSEATLTDISWTKNLWLQGCSMWYRRGKIPPVPTGSPQDQQG
jgi:hypothetical protein